MGPGLAYDILNGGVPEQFGPFARTGIKGSLGGISQLWQIALEEGLQGGHQQGLAETTGSGKKNVLRLQQGVVAADRSQQSVQMAGLVNVQAAGTANRDELGLIRVQEGQIHGRKARTGFHASLARRPDCTWLHRDRRARHPCQSDTGTHSRNREVAGIGLLADWGRGPDPVRSSRRVKAGAIRSSTDLAGVPGTRSGAITRDCHRQSSGQWPPRAVRRRSTAVRSRATLIQGSLH